MQPDLHVVGGQQRLEQDDGVADLRHDRVIDALGLASLGDQRTIRVPGQDAHPDT